MATTLRRSSPSVFAIVLFGFLIVLISWTVMAHLLPAVEAEAGPGATGTVPSNPDGYTQLELSNTGPGPVKVVVKSAGFNKTLTINEGDTLKLTEIFGPGKISITNESTAAMVKISAATMH